jgi:hypothetical protein
MTKIFIDTNLYLGLYDSGEDPGKIFGDIGALRSSLIFPDVVFDEFVRNRDRILGRYAKTVGDAAIAGLEPSFFLSQLPVFQTLLRAGDEYNGRVRSMVNDIQQMIAEPERDPIFGAFSRLYSDREVLIIQRTEMQVERARQRKLIGNPPGAIGKIRLVTNLSGRCSLST